MRSGPVVFLLVRWDSVPLLSRAAVTLGFLERLQALRGECDGHDNRIRAGVFSRLHRVFYGSRPLSDGVAGAGLLVPFPKVEPGSCSAPIRACG